MLGHDRKTSPYIELEVPRTASQKQIRQAYLRLVKHYHPDRFDPQNQPHAFEKATQKMQNINQAYSLIGDPEKRSHYESIRKNYYGSHRPEAEPSSTSTSSASRKNASHMTRPTWKTPSKSEAILAFNLVYLFLSVITIILNDGIYMWLPLILPACLSLLAIYKSNPPSTS